MKTKKNQFLILMAVFIVGCNNKLIETDNEDGSNDINFCSCLNTENFGKIIPIINEGFSNSVCPWNMLDLPKWLKEHPCVIDAKVIYRGRAGWWINDETEMTEIVLTFEGNGITKTFILEVSDTESINGPYSKLKVEGYYEYFFNKYNLCSLVAGANIDRTIPVINEFLSALPNEFAEEQKLRALEKWLNIQPCVEGAYIEHYSAVKTNPPTGEVHLRFLDNNELWFYVMDIKWTNPMTVTGYHDLFYEHEDTEKLTEIPSMEYSLVETSCQWSQTIQEIYFHRKLIIINSMEELENCITCAEGSVCPAIDFTKHTLLLAFGVESGDIKPNSTYLHLSSTGYVLNVEWTPSIAAVQTRWQTAIIVDKLPEESRVELKINRLIKKSP